jgi:ribonucleoside-diphosphate reductase alpha chain
MISAVFRRGGSVKFVGHELKRISDPTGGSWINKEFIPSFVALLGKTIQEHCGVLEVMNGTAPMEALPGGRCKKCNELAVIINAGCATCASCGDSKCG